MVNRERQGNLHIIGVPEGFQTGILHFSVHQISIRHTQGPNIMEGAPILSRPHRATAQVSQEDFYGPRGCFVERTETARVKFQVNQSLVVRDMAFQTGSKYWGPLGFIKVSQVA